MINLNKVEMMKAKRQCKHKLRVLPHPPKGLKENSNDRPN
jgi:hypothetical protein